MKRLLAVIVTFAMLVCATGAATLATAKAGLDLQTSAKAVADTTYTLTFEYSAGGKGTLTVSLPEGISNGKIAIKTSADLTYVANSAVGTLESAINETAIDTKGLIISFADALGYDAGTVVLTAEYSVASGAVIDSSDFIVDNWKLGDGTSFISTNADGAVNVVIKEKKPLSVGDNLLLNKPYTVSTDATVNKADGGDYVTNGAIRGDGTNDWNGDLGVTGVTIEWFGTSKTITYTFTFDAATDVTKIVFRNVRIASNRAFGTVVVNGSTVVTSSDAVKTAVEGAPLYGTETLVEQYFDVTVPVELTGVTELTIAIITDKYVCQYDEIEAYGPASDDPSEEPSEDVPSEEPSEDVPSVEPSEDVPSEEPSEDVPSVEPSEDVPSEGPSEDVPSEEPSEDVPSEEPSEDAPSEEPSEDVPSVEPSEDVPSEEPSEDAPSVEPSEDDSSEDISVDESTEDESSEDESTDEPADILYGDVNGDGAVNSLDAAQTLKHDAKLIVLDAMALLRSEVNGDGVVNSLDAAQILKFDAKLIALFPIEVLE